MISVVISAYNEEKNIKDCIESIQDLAAEIIVVDNSSTDKTSEIAKKMGAKVFKQANDAQKIDLQKNYGFEKASHDWVLSLDADERLTPELIAEIKHEIEKHPKVSGFWIPRKNIIFNKWIRHSLWWPDYQLRLFKKGKGKFLKATVHVPLNVSGETQHISEPMIHHSYSSISQYVNRMNNIYTDVEVEGLMRSGKKFIWIDAIRLPFSDFFKTFFLQKGYQDGLHGLVLSLLQAFYMFLLFAKVWERQGFYEKSEKEILKGISSEMVSIESQGKFWLFTALQHGERNPFRKLLYVFSKKTNSL